MTPIKTPKKLIEVALPLDAINAAAAREKSIRHGHPSTLHLWWARRPLAAARAVIFAQMVNDPGYQQGGGFKYGVNKEKAAIERERLFRIIEDLVKWENTNNEEVLERARAEIRRSWRETCELNKNHPQAAELFNPDKLPAFHDPFAGGGALPLEAQRLGLESYASDLNPVAVTINKAMIEIPPRFAGCAPVGPIPQGEKQVKLHDDWSGARGLAEDVRRYGAWMRAEAEKRIGHLYPKIEITAEMAGSAGVPPASGQDGRAPSTRASRPDLVPLIGQKLTVIAWLWARTVRSPNPAFSHAEVPLASTFILSSKKGKEAYVEPVVEGDRYYFTVKTGTPPEEAKNGTKLARGANFRCLLSDSPIEPKHIYAEANAGRMGERLMAIVAEGVQGRVYLAPTPKHEAIALEAQPTWKPEVMMPENPRWFSPPLYGLKSYGDLFTPRQLVALTTFSDLVQEAIEKCRNDYLGARASRPQKTWHTRGYLPHWEAGQIPQSITFRLHDSLPRQLLEQWQTELDSLPPDQQTLERRKRIEAALDQGYGECHLRRADIAGIVATALRHFDGERYQLIAWTIMPNHVHVLVIPLHGYSLSSILHSWKSFTAKEANRLLERTGAFWLEEYFDRAIRDEVHYARAVAYIENNPVKAGLCDSAAEWPWGSAWERGRPARRAARMAAPPGSRDAVPLDEGGSGATAYAQAVGVYLGFGVDRLADRSSTICGWDTGYTKIRNTFGRQAIPMTWDYCEGNAFSTSTGNFEDLLEWVHKFLSAVPTKTPGLARQADAATLGARASGPQAGGTPALPVLPVVSTDPPYYDNIGYADLSDFFYVWLRKSLKPIFPGLYATLAVPKAEELVATPYRHGSKEKAETFFLDGMTRAIHNLAEQAHPAFPVTIYYAFKQAETRGDEGTSSTGWETFLAAVLSAGFTLTGTWPMRTELGNRMIGAGTNALASSIVLVCRKRPADAPTVSRREFIRELNAALPDALDEMTRGGINSPVAPVDLSQAIIGPGMAIFSQYAAVLEADGTPMRVKTALQLINRFLAEDDFDHDTQFCLHWFEQQGWATGKFGEADVLARAKGTSVAGLQEAGVVTSGKGDLRLLRWDELPCDWSPETDTRLPVWEALHHLIRALNKGGGESAAGALLAHMPARAESIRALAYRLYTLCERKGWADDARAYNELVTAWSNIERAASEIGRSGEQTGFDNF